MSWAQINAGLEHLFYSRVSPLFEGVSEDEQFARTKQALGG